MIFAVEPSGTSSYSRSVDNRFGNYLRQLLKRRGIRIKHLVSGSGAGRTTVYRHLKGEVMPDIDDRRVYAGIVKVPFDEFEAGWQENENSNLRAAPKPPPHFQGLSATRADGRDVIRIDDPDFDGQIAEFRMTIDGNCMWPKYPHGSIVTFAGQEATKADKLIHGKDYFIRFKTGDMTFKRVLVLEDSRDFVELVCRNPEFRTTSPWIVSLSEIDGAAKAIRVEQSVEDNDPPPPKSALPLELETLAKQTIETHDDPAAMKKALDKRRKK